MPSLYHRPMRSGRNNCNGLDGHVALKRFASSPPPQVMGHEIAVVQGRLGHAAKGSVGVITDDENIIFGLQVSIHAYLAAAHNDKIISLEERVVGHASRPNDGMAANRLAVNGQLI